MRTERGSLTQLDFIYITIGPVGEHKKTGQWPGLKTVVVKLAALGDTGWDAVLPGAGRVPRPGRVVFGIRPDASRCHAQGQAHEENREEGEDGPGE